MTTTTAKKQNFRFVNPRYLLIVFIEINPRIESWWSDSTLSVWILPTCPMKSFRLSRLCSSCSFDSSETDTKFWSYLFNRWTRCQPHVLPRINADVKKLRVNQHSLGRVLHLTTRYAQLDSLALTEIDDQFLSQVIPGKSFLLRVEFSGEFEFLFINRSWRHFFSSISRNKSYVRFCIWLTTHPPMHLGNISSWSSIFFSMHTINEIARRRQGKKK